MSVLPRVLSRLLAGLRPGMSESDLDDEIASHLAEATDEYVRQGMSLEDASRAARRDFGGVIQTKEIYRDVRRFAWVEACWRDVRFAVRMLVKDRWVTLAAVVALSLGIAANTTVFTIVNAILLRPLPFEDASRIVAIGTRSGSSQTLTAGLSYADVEDWGRAARTFEGIGAMKEATMNLGDGGLAPERFIGAYVTANTFTLLRQQPLRGRGVSVEDERPGAAPVVLLGEWLWRQRYGASPAILGRTIRVNGVSSTVIGVMPDGFSFPTRSRLWQPLTALPDRTSAKRDVKDLSGFGRLAPGVEMRGAAAELRGIASAMADRRGEAAPDEAPVVVPFHERSVGKRGRSTLPVLMAVVAGVLLLACANVGNLLLARAAARTHEMSVRMAIGAGRATIVRQLLVESLVLATLAGVVGFAASLGAVRAIYDALGGGALPYWIRFTVDWRVFAFSTGICLVTVLAFGLVPALQLSRPAIAGLLVETGRTTMGPGRSRRWTHALVVMQLVLTPILLAGGGLMMRSIVAQYQVDAGVRTAGVMWTSLELPEATYPAPEDRARFYQQLGDRLAQLPGVEASLVSHAPFGGGAGRNLWLDHETVGPQAKRPRVLLVTAGPGYFGGFARGVTRGADLVLAQPAGDAPPVIINEWLAATAFAGEDPIGRRIRLTLGNGTFSGPEWYTVTGIAPNIRQSSTNDASGRDGVVYLSYGSNPQPRANIVARSNLAPPAVVSAVREQVRALDPDLPLFDMMSLDDVLASSDERVGMRVFGGLFAGFAAVGLLLATVGLYAVTAYAAVQRRREIGLRVALGARPAQICWLVTRRAAWQLGLGLPLGIVGAMLMGRALRGVLIGVGPTDPATLLGIAALLVVVALSACLPTAVRAARIAPASVLRSD